MFRRLALFAAFTLALLSMTENTQAASLEDTLYLELKSGRVVIEMRPDLAPKHCLRIKELVRKGFYDGLTFHRVIQGFMAQTGDPRGDGTGGSGQKIQAEFTDKEQFYRGMVGMARSADPNSADSQFFIMLGESPHLNGKYTIWGEVVKGMENVDWIKKGDPRRNGEVQDPDRIVSLRVAADVKQ